MSRFGRGAEPDDWVSRGEWRRWDAPEADVALAPGAGRLLAAMLPRGGAARMPVPAALVPEPDGTVAVEAGGYRVGRLAAGALDDLGDDLAEAAAGRLAVPGLIVRAGDPDARPRLRLWARRRLSDGTAVTLERQREAHASRVEGWPQPR